MINNNSDNNNNNDKTLSQSCVANIIICYSGKGNKEN